MPKQGKAKRDGVINPQITISMNLNTEKLMLSKRYESTEVDRRIRLHVPSGTLWSTSSDTLFIFELILKASYISILAYNRLSINYLFSLLRRWWCLRYQKRQNMNIPIQKSWIRHWQWISTDYQVNQPRFRNI